MASPATSSPAASADVAEAAFVAPAAGVAE